MGELAFNAGIALVFIVAGRKLWKLNSNPLRKFFAALCYAIGIFFCIALIAAAARMFIVANRSISEIAPTPTTAYFAPTKVVEIVPTSSQRPTITPTPYRSVTPLPPILPTITPWFVWYVPNTPLPTQTDEPFQRNVK